MTSAVGDGGYPKRRLSKGSYIESWKPGDKNCNKSWKITPLASPSLQKAFLPFVAFHAISIWRGERLKWEHCTEPENMACMWFGEICFCCLARMNKFHQNRPYFWALYIPKLQCILVTQCSLTYASKSNLMRHKQGVHDKIRSCKCDTCPNQIADHIGSHVQGDTSRCAKPPVDFKTKVPLWSGAGQNGTFVLESTGGFARDVSPCTTKREGNPGLPTRGWTGPMWRSSPAWGVPCTTPSPTASAASSSTKIFAPTPSGKSGPRYW